MLTFLVQPLLFSSNETIEIEPDIIYISIGRFDATRKRPKWLGQMEYRPGYLCSKVRPYISMFLTENQSIFASTGLALDVFLFKSLVFTPSFGPGIYFQGKGKNLYHPFSLRSSVDLSVAFSNFSRIGVQLSHISNAGITKKNPGSEILTIFYAIPL
ncbi:MAG: acyloxyacyl hydrolase [Chlamydiales bacterium]